MAGDDSRQGSEKPSEQRGGTTPGGAEAREKGEWAGTAQDGIVPADLGGSDAPREMLDEDPQLGSDVLGRTTGGIGCALFGRRFRTQSNCGVLSAGMWTRVTRTALPSWSSSARSDSENPLIACLAAQ